MHIRLAVAALAATGLAATGLLAPIPGAAATTRGVSAPQADTGTVATSFGMEHHAFGTRVDGNRAVRSGPTANSIIGCTTLAGLVRRNHVAGVDLPLVTAEEVTSRGTTTKQDGVVTVTSTNTITSGSLGTDVRFRGLSSQSRTWHDDRGFHNQVTMDLARLSIGGDQVQLGAGTQQFDVAGGELTVFARSTKNTGESASANGVVLRLKLADGTRVFVGSSLSRMRAQVFGPMSGSTWGSQVRLGDGTVSSGKTAYQVVPCQGTDGVVRENTTAGPQIVDAVSARTVSTEVWAVQGPQVQKGYTQAEIARAKLGAVDLLASGIQSQANVERTNGELSRSAQGTHLLRLELAGADIRDNLDPGVPEFIPGLGTVTFKKVKEIPNGIEVVALHVVLDDPDHTVIELGHSIMRIAKN